MYAPQGMRYINRDLQAYARLMVSTTLWYLFISMHRVFSIFSAASSTAAAEVVEVVVAIAPKTASTTQAQSSASKRAHQHVCFTGPTAAH
jgi:hypothetical protein